MFTLINTPEVRMATGTFKAITHDSEVLDDAQEITFGQRANITLKAGIYGLLNNATQLGQAMGVVDDDKELLDVVDYYERKGDYTLANEYSTHSGAYDLAGGLLTSVVPATGALKAINLVKAGNSARALKFVSYFDGRANNLRASISAAYAAEGSAAAVGSLKTQLFAATAAQQFVEGALVTGAVEATQNYGEIFNSEGLSAVEKVLRVGEGLAVGGLLQFGIGGAIESRVLSGSMRKELTSVVAENELPFTYRSLSPRVGNVPVAYTPGEKITHVIGEIDRLDTMPTVNELQGKIKNANLERANTEFQAVITDMFPRSDMSDSADTLRKYMRTAASTAEGRSKLIDNFAELNSVKYTTEDAVDSAELLTKALSDIEIQRVSTQRLSELKSARTSGKRDSVDMFVDVNKTTGKPTVSVLDSLPDDLVTRKKAIAHADVFIKYSKSATSINNDLDSFAVKYGMSANEPVYNVVARAYQYSKNPRNKLATDFPELDKYFKTLGDEMSTAVYANTVKSYLNVVTGKLTDSPIKHIADLSGFSYSNAQGVVRWAAKDGTAKVFTRANLKPTNTVTDLLEYQATRLLSTGKKLSSNIVSKMNVDDAYILEDILSRTTGDIKLANNAVLRRDAVLDFISTTKGSEFERLLEANPGTSADDIYNTIGYNDISQTAGILSAKVKGSNVVSEAEIVNPASKLGVRQSVSMVYNKTDKDTATISASLFAESQRAELHATFKAVAAKVLGLSDAVELDKLLPELPVEAAIGFGMDRNFFPATAIGEYGSMIAKATRIGSFTSDRAERVFNSSIKTPFVDTATTLAKTPAASAEFLALAEWYYNQSGKYFNVYKGVYAAEDVSADILSKLKTGSTIEQALKGYVKGKDYNQLHHAESIAHMETFEALNKTKIASNKLNISQAYGNSDSFDLAALYLPPRDFKFTTYVIENATNPLMANAETVYRIAANTKTELEAKVREAMNHSANNGLNWVVKDPSDIAGFAQARGKFDWDGLDISKAYASSNQHRAGTVQSFTPESDIAKVLADHLSWLQRSNLAVHRAAVELKYADEISKLNTLARAEDAQLSRQLGVEKASKKMGDYAQIMHTMLGSDAHGYSTWKMLNNNLEDMTAKMLTVINKSISTVRLSKDKIATFEAEASAVEAELKKMGVGLPMAKAVEERIAREMVIEPADIRNAVSWLNHVQSALLLRLDATDSAMNLIGNVVKTSGEMQFLKKRYATLDDASKTTFDAEVNRLFGAGGSITDFGTAVQFKSIGKAYSKAVAEIYTDVGKSRIDGWVSKELLAYEDKVMRDMFEEIRISPDMFKTTKDVESWKTRGMKAAANAYEFVATPSRASNLLTQYVALDIAETLGKAAKLSDAELDAFVFKFSRSVNAVYNAPQKPRMFQGAAGIVMSLYQGYMFHMLANIFRYADAGVRSAPAMVAAMNSTFFGASSLPGFNYINNHVAGMNPDRVDLYDAAATSLGQSQGRDLSDFVMYGAGALLLQQNMHTRGGLTPRSPILIPSSVQDVPLAQVMVKTVSSASDTAHNIMYGAPIVPSLWDGLVNIGMNRPLTGLADVLRGKSVDSQYNTVMYHEDMFSIGSAFRLVGMRPLNEQVAKDFQFRQMQFKARDAALKKALSEEIRVIGTRDPTKLDDGAYVDSLARRYLKAGGTMERFDDFLVDQLAKGEGDIYDRLEKTLGNKYDDLSRLRDITGAYE